MAGIRVHELRVADEGRWQFRDSALAWSPPGGYTARFDPFAAYAHDRAAAEDAAACAQDRCPPLWDVDCYAADREEIARSNGYSDLIERHSGDTKAVSGLILMSGKRIPPHPAVTRYLVGHEYGHNVAFMLNSLRDGCKHISSTAELERDYATVRGLPESSLHHGEGGTWHDSAAEILACDFRILVLGMETEFWPHPGIERPEKVVGLAEWWAGSAAQLAGARKAPPAP